VFLKLCGLRYGGPALVKASWKMVWIRAALRQCGAAVTHSRKMGA